MHIKWPEIILLVINEENTGPYNIETKINIHYNNNIYDN